MLNLHVFQGIIYKCYVQEICVKKLQLTMYKNICIINKRTGITKYRPNQGVMSLAQRLELEKKKQIEQEKKQQQTQSFLTKVISYIW